MVVSGYLDQLLLWSVKDCGRLKWIWPRLFLFLTMTSLCNAYIHLCIHANKYMCVCICVKLSVLLSIYLLFWSPFIVVSLICCLFGEVRSTLNHRGLMILESLLCNFKSIWLIVAFDFCSHGRRCTRRFTVRHSSLWFKNEWVVSLNILLCKLATIRCW